MWTLKDEEELMIRNMHKNGMSNEEIYQIMHFAGYTQTQIDAIVDECESI